MAVFEAKYARSLETLHNDYERAIQQIDEKMYAKEFEDDYDQVFCYGIAFFKKRCMIEKKQV